MRLLAPLLVAATLVTSGPDLAGPPRVVAQECAWGGYGPDCTGSGRRLRDRLERFGGEAPADRRGRRFEDRQDGFGGRQERGRPDRGRDWGQDDPAPQGRFDRRDRGGRDRGDADPPAEMRRARPDRLGDGDPAPLRDRLRGRADDGGFAGDGFADDPPARRRDTAADGACLSPSEARRVVASGEAASLSRIRGNIADMVGGEVVSAQLCQGGGGYIYVVNVIVDGGAVQRYRVDALSGDLLGR